MRDEVEDAAGRRSEIAAGVIDVFVYVVVLNLFIEYFPKVLSESFTLTLLTALLLKGILELVVLAEKPLRARFRHADTGVGKVVAGALQWGVLLGSKFLVLEVVAVAFRGRVYLGGFFLVVALIVVLLVARTGVRFLLRWASQTPARRDSAA